MAQDNTFLKKQINKQSGFLPHNNSKRCFYRLFSCSCTLTSLLSQLLFSTGLMLGIISLLETKSSSKGQVSCRLHQGFPPGFLCIRSSSTLNGLPEPAAEKHDATSQWGEGMFNVWFRPTPKRVFNLRAKKLSCGFIRP